MPTPGTMRLRLMFGGAVFLGSFLLFLVEPVAAKELLPWLGGSAAVWITCLVFFQTALLCAYLYAHWLTRSSRWNLHLALLVLAAAAAGAWALRGAGRDWGSAHPVTTVFVALSLWIGLPFLMLGATSPLLQFWWHRLQSAGIPYRLFALSNLASLLALGLYPVVIEPHLTLMAQRLTWASGFAAYALISAVLTWRMRSSTTPTVKAVLAAESDEPAAPLRDKILWVLLPMGAAMQLAAVTSHLTSNIAAIPLLWILPLGVYLVTLILAFQFPRYYSRALTTRFLAVLLGGLALMLTRADVTWPLRISIGFYLAETFVACLFLHSEAYVLRPRRPSESTLFYLLFAAGGALGSFLIGIASPLIFRFNYDIAITFFATAVLALAVAWKANWTANWSQRLLWGVASIMLAVILVWMHIAFVRGTIAAERNFYAALRVKQDLHSFPGATVRTLTNGTIEHGTQIFGTDAQRRMPTTYYANDSGVGLALRFCCQSRPRNIGVIGLGAGTIAAYGRPGDRITFYEINPGVAPIAKNVFTYLRESAARIRIVDGDGRLSLAHEALQRYDVLVVDAFSGDAIPLHLLTLQAMRIYRRQLAPGGIIAFHISNRHVNLGPPIALLAQATGMQVRRISNLENENLGEFSATWMLVTDNAAFLDQPEVAGHSHVPALQPGLKLWTDDYSALLPVLHW